MIALVVRQFAIGYVIGVVILFALAVALDYFFAYEISSGVSVVPFVVGVHFAAQKYATQEGVQPSSGFAWRAAFAMTATGLAISAAISGLFLAVAGAEAMFGGAIPMNFFLIALVVVAAIYLLIGRFLFSFTIRSALKAAARRR